MKNTDLALPRDGHGLRTALLLLFAGAWLRCPPILLHGRMWGEELTVFLAQGWNRPVATALFAPHFGYFSVWDNCIAAFAIHVLPLSWMAWVFTWTSLVVLLLTGHFVYQAEFLTTRRAKTLGVLVLLLCPPSIETWINLLNSEFYFGILGAILLVCDANRLRVQRHLVLALAVLSGPLTTLLAPLYVLRAAIGRQRSQITQAALVSAGGLLQIGVAVGTSMQNRGVQPRLLNDGAILFNKDIVQLFLTRIAAKEDYLLLANHLHFSDALLAVFWLLLIVAVAALAYLVRSRRIALWLLLIAFWYALLEASLSTNGGLRFVDTSFQERYAYLPNVLIELSLIPVALAALRDRRRLLAQVLLGLALFSGAVDYLLLPLRARLNWQGEPWHAQVLRWQNDPTQPLQGFPITPTWQPIHLPPRD